MRQFLQCVIQRTRTAAPEGTRRRLLSTASGGGMVGEQNGATYVSSTPIFYTTSGGTTRAPSPTPTPSPADSGSSGFAISQPALIGVVVGVGVVVVGLSISLAVSCCARKPPSADKPLGKGA